MAEQMNETQAQQPEQQPVANPPGNDSGNTGIVYVVSNVLFEEYIKLGITRGNSVSDLRERIRRLNTAVPHPFHCEYAAVVENYEEVEKALLDAFGDFRVGPTGNRVRATEFLKNVSPKRIEAVLRLLQKQELNPDVSPEVGNVIDEGHEKAPPRENFQFPMAHIPEGALLQWIDDPRIQCKVVGNRKVEYLGKEYYLSGLARELKKLPYGLNGTLYWLYEGEALTERRRRFEDADGED